MSDVKLTAKEQGNQIVVNYYQDVEPHLKAAHAERRADAETRGAFGKRGDMHKVMSVPTNVIYGIAARLGIPFSDIFQAEQSKRIYAELKKLDFAAFRTTTDVNI